GPGDHWAECGEDVFASELIVPFVRAVAVVSPGNPVGSAPAERTGANDERALGLVPAGATVARAGAAGAGAARPAPRRFAPGSAWLYAKLHGRAATADALLRDGPGPLVRSLRARGVIEGWFFIRFADPNPHLRLRLRGDPARLWGG